MWKQLCIICCFVFIVIGLVPRAVNGNEDQVCLKDHVTKTETYWCFKGIFHWRCSRKVTKTKWRCSYFNERSSCYLFVERHKACGRGRNGGNYSFSWTDWCVGKVAGCKGAGYHIYYEKPSVSQGCSSDMYDCP